MTAWLDDRLATIDPVAVVRGISAGFSVLVIGGLAAPILAMNVPVVGTCALLITAVLGFVVAASRQGTNTNPALQGALAAVGAYLLVLPLSVLGSHGWNVVQIACTLAVAVVVGGLAGIAWSHAPQRVGGRR